MYHSIRSQHRTKYTPNQVKFLFHTLDRYSQQMAFKDLCINLATIKALSYHLQCKIHARRVYVPYKALKAITQRNHYKVIEINVTGDDIRYLLRGTDSFYCKVSGKIQRVNLCIVVSTRNQLIVTAYLNTCTDNHTTLDRERYSN